MDIIMCELERMGVVPDSVEPIRSKDGVTVARVRCGGRSLVIKAFQRAEFRREIENYTVLNSLGVPTLRVASVTDRALLLEDILDSAYRPGEARDLADPATAALVARWYRELHGRGRAYVERAGAALYDENDALTAENVAAIKERSGTGSLPVWRLIEDNWDKIRAAIDAVPRTLTYNDFYYTNLAVARDGSSALMFDYNLLGKGYAYADIRNVRSSLSREAGEAFLREYGPFDEREAEVDAVASVLCGLHSAYSAGAFPRWGEELLGELRGGMLSGVERLISGR